MTGSLEKDPLQKADNRSKTVLAFMEQSIGRLEYFKSCYRSSGAFAGEFQVRQYQDFHRQIAESSRLINDLLGEIGGISISFLKEADGEEIAGKVVGCGGFDFENNRWQVKVVNEEFPGVMGKPHLEIGVGAFELKNIFPSIVEDKWKARFYI